MAALIRPLALLPLLSFLAACESTSVWERPRPAEELVQRIEDGHHADAWRAHEVLELELSYAFADVAYDARAWIECATGRARLEAGDVTLVFDGEDVWMAPAGADFPSPAFHARVHAELVRLPYSLRDAELVELRGKRVWEGRRLALIEVRAPALAGTRSVLGATRFLHVDPRTDRVAAVGFQLAKFEGTDVGHAVTFEDPVTLDGVPLHTFMRAYRWSEETSLLPGPIAAIELSARRFVPAAASRFEPPPGAARVEPD